ncbi:MAG TPA: MFS transporter [Spirochaetia bacterium]|nr:MFS transporter [Spirochaetia bacterium]
MNSTRNVRLLIAVSFLQGFVFYGPVATLYRRAYGLALDELFLIESVSWILMLLLEAPWGWFADRFGYRRTLVAGNLLFAASKLVFAGASGFGGFLAERLVLSVAVAAISGCDSALLYRSSREGEAERNFGLQSAAATAGIVLASLLSPLLYGVSLRWTAYATILPYSAAAALSFLLSDEGAPPPRERRFVLSSLKRLLSDRRLLLLLASGALAAEVSRSLVVFLGQLQYERSGIPRAWFGLIFAALQLVPIVAGAAGALSRRIDRRAVILSCLAAELLSVLVLLLAPARAAVSLLALAGVSASAALFAPYFQAVQNELVGTGERATALSLNAMVVEGVAAAANLGVGRAAEASLSRGYLLCALLLAAALALSPLYLRLARPRAVRAAAGADGRDGPRG